MEARTWEELSETNCIVLFLYKWSVMLDSGNRLRQVSLPACCFRSALADILFRSFCTISVAFVFIQNFKPIKDIVVKSANVDSQKFRGLQRGR